MAYTPIILYPTNFPTAGGVTMYTVPESSSVIVKNVVLTNTTPQEAAVNVSIVPSGGSVSASNRILSGFSVPANGVSTLDLSIVMPAGSSLHGTNLTADAVAVTISGVQIS